MMWSSTIRVILISLALAAWSAPSFAAPMVVATSSDAAALAENLAGAGITIVSATLEAGDGATAGTFLGDGGDNDRDAFLAFDSGVVLSTGPAEGLAGSNDEDYGGTGSGLDLDLAAGASCDDDSASLAHEGLCDFDPGNGQSVFDATWLEIVFIPEQDELTLTYVFASEEWNADGDANAGDVLGVWVNEVGCALTSTGSSVGSHSIHSGTPELFISNGAAELLVEANGLTTTLECVRPVTPGVENTLKVGVANAGDRERESWLLLERDGMSASIPIVTPLEDVDGDGIPDIYDNCPAFENVDQADLDGNGLGDLCETDALSVGGGACGAGGDGTSSLLLLLLALMALALVRRRTRRSLVALVLVVGLAHPLDAAHAAEAPNLDIQLFHPSPFVGDLFSAPRRSEHGGDHWSVGLLLHHQQGPVSIRRPPDDPGLLPLSDSPELIRLVDQDTAMNFLMAYDILDGFSLGLDLPVLLSRTGAYSDDLPVLTGSSLGDLRILSRVQLMGRRGRPFALGLNLGIVAPTHSGAFRGRSSIAFLTDLFAEVRAKKSGLSLRGGVLWATEQEVFLDVTQEHQLQVELGYWRSLMGRDLEAIVELQASTELNDRFAQGAVSPAELRVGARWRPMAGLTMGVGMGTGLSRGIGAPDLRALFSLTFDSWYVQSQSQLDGVAGQDRCPTEEEDKDGYQDEDGCPDPDVERPLDVIVDRPVPPGTFVRPTSASARSAARARRARSVAALAGANLVAVPAAAPAAGSSTPETPRMLGSTARRKRTLRKAPPGNQVPTIGRVLLSPEAPRTGQPIQCTYEGFRDPDGDPDDSLVDWFVNGKDAGFGPTLERGYVKGDRVRCVVTPHDGAVGGPKKHAELVVANSLPAVREARVTPAVPKGGDTLQCVYKEFSDPDGDPDRSVITWTVNGLRAGKGRVLDTQVAAGDHVACTVTPKDGVGTGDPVRASVVVDNTPPSITSAWMEPKEVVANAKITCRYDGFKDADFHGDKSLITWLVNGKSVGSGATVEKGFVGGDNLECVVTPFDGKVKGEPMRVQRTVANSPPKIDMVAIRPGKARYGDLLQCIYTGFEDPDGDRDASKVRWGINGKLVGEGKVLNSKIRSGDVVTCVVEPNDGTDSGEERRAELTVGNTAPTVESVSLYPTEVRHGDKISCTYDGYLDVDGDTDASRIQWKVNGKLAGWNRVLETDVKRGDQIACEVEPFDGKDKSKTVSSEVLKVANTVPTLKLVRIVSLHPSAAQGSPERKHLKCLTKGYQDVDGDADAGSKIVWEVNNEPAGHGPNLERELSPEDWVRCKVTPYDGYDFGKEISAYTKADTAWSLAK